MGFFKDLVVRFQFGRRLGRRRAFLPFLALNKKPLPLLGGEQVRQECIQVEYPDLWTEASLPQLAEQLYLHQRARQRSRSFALIKSTDFSYQACSKHRSKTRVCKVLKRSLLIAVFIYASLYFKPQFLVAGLYQGFTCGWFSEVVNPYTCDQ